MPAQAPEPPRADLDRARALIEESREIVVVLDESRRVVTASRRARESLDGEVVAIDGKTLRRSFDRAASQGAIPMVSAWANASRLV